MPRYFANRMTLWHLRNYDDRMPALLQPLAERMSHGSVAAIVVRRVVGCEAEDLHRRTASTVWP